MTATARTIRFTDDDISGGGNYDSLEVPNDYSATLTKVEDFDNRQKGGSFGWVFHYDIEGLAFRTWLSFKETARWKLTETLRAFGVELQVGDLQIDPEALVGMEVGAHVDFPPDYYKALEQGLTPDRPYREIRWVFALPPENAPVNTEAEEPEVL